MKILIIEDEENAAIQLINMIKRLNENVQFYETIDNIEKAVHFLSKENNIDLIFLDIHLSDGSSFEIFREVKIDIPVIFTTAYDQYAIQAFEVNSVDYLLKPIRLEKLGSAIEKYKRLHYQTILDKTIYQKLSTFLDKETSFTNNFLIPVKDKLIPVAVAEFAWFEISDGIVTGTKLDNTPLIMEQRSLEELVAVLNPDLFYRANRQFLISRNAILEIEYYFNGRLSVKLQPSPNEKVLISKARANNFKDWMNRS